MGKINLTISSSDKTVLVEYLLGDTATVTGSELIRFTRLRDELDGWWFDKLEEAEHNRKVMFADIVNLNGSPIGATTQAAVTALLSAAISVPGVPYSEYSVFISQSGTSAPTVNIINDTITGVTITRSGVGTYLFTKTGAFVSGKTVPVDDTYFDQAGNLYKLNRTSSDVMTLRTYAAIDTTALADNVLSGRFLSIIVYF